jgi:hypothetical protein
MSRRFLIALALFAATSAVAAAQAPTPAPPPAKAAVDITGKWTASFDTQIGVQNYTYDFVAKDTVLTGKATSDNGTAELKDGKIDGATVTFTENLDFGGTPIAIAYTGTIASADEIRFTRKVGDFATEELVAKRAR